MKDFVIFPKEYFENGTVTGRHYAVHLCAGEWRIKADTSRTFKGRIKALLHKNQKVFDIVQVLVRKRRYGELKKQIPFYGYYLAQKNHTQLPEL